MLFSPLHFRAISILVPTFLFYHFQSLIQLTLVILVLSVSQQMEIADVANGLIKILIKIHHGSCSPMPPGFPAHLFTRDPHYPQNQYQKPKIPQIDPLSPKPNQSTFSPDLRQPSNHHSKQTNKPPSQINKPRNIYTQTPFSWNSREKKSRETRYCSEISKSVRQRPNTQVLALSVCMSLYIASFILCVGATMLLLYTLFGF